MTRPNITTDAAMPVHRATANDRTSQKETAALDKLAGRLPNGPTAAMLDLVRISAYTFGNHAARRWCQQLVRDNKPLPRRPGIDEMVDADGVRLEGTVGVALAELWGDCDALLWAAHGMRAALAQPPPGRELATVQLERIPAQADRYRAYDVAAMHRWAAEHDDSAPGWMDRAAAALDADRRTAGLAGEPTEMVVLDSRDRTQGGAR